MKQGSYICNSKENIQNEKDRFKIMNSLCKAIELPILHDIGLRENIVVPLIMAGSNEIPMKEIPFCKTTDIVPTLLKMLGKKPHKSVIGKSLI